MVRCTGLRQGNGQLLRGAGFDVIESIDLSPDQLIQRLLKFGDKANGADSATFVDGSEFLLATSADVKS